MAVKRTMKSSKQALATTIFVVVALSLLLSLATVLTLMAQSISEAVNTAKEVSAAIEGWQTRSRQARLWQGREWLSSRGWLEPSLDPLRGGGGVKPHEAPLEGQGQKGRPGLP